MHSLTSKLDGRNWSASHPSRFTPRERAPGTHWIVVWVGPRAGLDMASKRKDLISRRESNIDRPVRSYFTELSQLVDDEISRETSLKMLTTHVKVFIITSPTAFSCQVFSLLNEY